MKTCSKCKQSKDESEFNKKASASDGLAHWCRDCSKIVRNNWYAVSNKSSRRFKEYGITEQTYKQLLNKQNSRCAICKVVLGGLTYIDHSHSTGVVRGILCSSCNIGLGHFKDSPELLTEAKNYLLESRPKESLQQTLFKLSHIRGIL